MGLDMYLSAEEYVSGWNHGSDEEKERYRTVLGALGKKPEDITGDSPHLEVSYSVAYWRKANAIHNWFVTNVQDGKDECQRSYVSREQLVQLRDLAAKELILYKSNAFGGPGKLLPPVSGFFFGSTEIDEYYKADLESTVDQLTKVLDNPRLGNLSFYYQSSW